MLTCSLWVIKVFLLCLDYILAPSHLPFAEVYSELVLPTEILKPRWCHSKWGYQVFNRWAGNLWSLQFRPSDFYRQFKLCVDIRCVLSPKSKGRQRMSRAPIYINLLKNILQISNFHEEQSVWLRLRLTASLSSSKSQTQWG